MLFYPIFDLLKDQQGRQSPREYLADKTSGSQSPSLASNVRLNTANSGANNSTSLNNASRNNNQPVVASGKNEKEIQIQRVSSSSNNNNDLLTNNKLKLSGDSPASSPTSTSGNKVVNYIDIQVVNSKSQNNNNSNNANVMTTPAVSSPTSNQSQLDLNSKTSKSPLAQSNNLSNLIQQQSPTVNKQQVHQQKPRVNLNIPAFHFPTGRPDSRQFKSCEDVETMKAIASKFKASKEGGKIMKDEFGEIVKMLDLPLYWKTLILRACTLNSKFNYVTYPILEQVWSK
jgi:hypothetical protein